MPQPFIVAYVLCPWEQVAGSPKCFRCRVTNVLRLPESQSMQVLVPPGLPLPPEPNVAVIRLRCSRDFLVLIRQDSQCLVLCAGEENEAQLRSGRAELALDYLQDHGFTLERSQALITPRLPPRARADNAYQIAWNIAVAVSESNRARRPA